EHLPPLQAVAAGLRALPGPRKPSPPPRPPGASAATPASLSPGSPSPCSSRRGGPQRCDDHALAAHDRSVPHHDPPPSERDRVPPGISQPLGYELRTSLLVSDRDGVHLAPVCRQVRGAGGVCTTRSGVAWPTARSWTGSAPS